MKMDTLQTVTDSLLLKTIHIQLFEANTETHSFYLFNDSNVF